MSAYHFAVNDSIAASIVKATRALAQSLLNDGMFDTTTHEDIEVLLEEVRNLVTIRYGTIDSYTGTGNNSIVAATDKATIALFKSLLDDGMFDRAVASRWPDLAQWTAAASVEDIQGPAGDVAAELLEEVRNLVTNHLEDMNK